MKLLLAGDSKGVRQLLDHTPVSNVAGICAASVRPQYLGELHDLAKKLCVPLLIQPRVRELDYPDFVTAIQSLKTDLMMVNSYSMLIHPEILLASRLGGLNLHASLLPKNRGPNPIQWALLRGENRTGVTLHEMTDRFDEGPIIAQKEIPIFPEDTWLTVQSRLKKASDQLLEETLPSVYAGTWVATPQIEMESSNNPRRSLLDSRFEWTDRLIDIYRLLRAVLPPHPPAWSITKQGNRLEIVEPLTAMELLRLVWPEREGLSVGGGEMNISGLNSEGLVHLRPIRREDSGLLYEWITDRELVLLNSSYWPVSEIDHENWLESMLIRRSDLVIFIIEDMDGNSFGTCQLVNINWVHRSAELQIRIGSKTNQGRGLGTAAVKMLCEFGFDDLGLHRISLFVRAGNLRARRAYEKAGFLQEGVMKEAALVNGDFEDVVVMGVVRV